MKSDIRLLLVVLLLAVPAGTPRAGQRPDWSIQPFATLIGGIKLESVVPLEATNIELHQEDQREDRIFTVAMSRFGFRGRLSGGFSFRSEFEFNAGYNGHGSGVWEGQAAVQVLTQVLRFSRWGLQVDLGHVRDESSVNYYALHVADQMMTDRYTRDQFIASGLNRGNGIYLTYEFLKGLRLGFTVNAANPTSNTGILVVGGSYIPFDYFYLVAVKDLAQNPNHFPRDTMHLLILSPSLTYQSSFLQAQASAQFFRVNTTTDSTSDDPIEGVNLRAGVRGHLFGDLLVPFANFSTVGNNTLDTGAGNTTREGNDWEGFSLSAGLDLNIVGPNGVGFQYGRIWGMEGNCREDPDSGVRVCPTRRTQQYINVGGTYWLTRSTSLGARFAYYFKEDVQEHDQGDRILTDGEMALFLIVRLVL